MATKKPRITISLNPHVYATLKRMSELGGDPMASIVSELLGTVHEPLMRTVAFLEAAAEAPKQVRDGLRQSFETVERDLYKSVGHSVDQIDWLTQQLGKVDEQSEESMEAYNNSRMKAGGAAGAPARAATPAPTTKTKRAQAASNPRNVIRGSGSTRSGGKKSGRP